MFSLENLSYHLARILALLIALVLHELAHGVVALLNGDNTAKINGRLTLNPAKHFDLLGFFMILTLSFGYGKPVPVNPYNFKKRKLGLFTVSIAGVTVNFLLSFLFLGIYIPLKFYTSIFQAGVLGVFLNWFFVLSILINIYIMLFNLLPIYPLDGFNAIASVCKQSNPYVRMMKTYGHYIILGLILVSLIGNYFLSSLVTQYPFLDPLSYVLNTIANFIINPLERFWMLVWGVA